MQFPYYMHEKPKEKKWLVQSHSGVNSDPALGTFASLQHSKSLPLTLFQDISPRVNNREPLPDTQDQSNPIASDKHLKLIQ
jgi:hypothetical protein